MKFSEFAATYIGTKAGDARHKEIIDGYNNGVKPLPRGYKVKYDDQWCATFASYVMLKCGAINAPYECSCYYMLNMAKERGQVFKTPKVNDFIIYDWYDDGSPNHVGVVSEINGEMLTVIEGNYKKGVNVRTISKNHKEIECYIRLEQEKKTNEEPQDLNAVALEVIAGKWGNGETRKVRLTNAGYDYALVQGLVNEIVRGKDKIDLLAHEVIQGKWGNGTTRKQKLTAAGYDYATVQARVNKILRG